MGCLRLLLVTALAVTFPALGVPVLVLWILLSDSRRKREIRKRRERVLVERTTQRERKRLKRKARADDRRERRKWLAWRERRNELMKCRRGDVKSRKRLSGGPSHGPTRQSLSVSLLREALGHEGRITVTQGVAATEESIAVVKACLDSMVDKGYVDVGNHPESGAVVYVFAETVPKSVFSERRRAIERAIRRYRKQRRMPTSTRPIQLSSLLLYEAKEHGGRLTITQGVMATGQSYEAVEACLQDMVDSHFVEVDNDPGSGVVAYEFAEMTGQPPDDSVAEPRTVRGWGAAEVLLGWIRRVRVWRGKQRPPQGNP